MHYREKKIQIINIFKFNTSALDLKLFKKIGNKGKFEGSTI